MLTAALFAPKRRHYKTSRGRPGSITLLFVCFFYDLNLPDHVINCIVIADGSTKTNSVLSYWSLWTSFYAEAWGVYLHIQDKQLFCHVGNSSFCFLFCPCTQLDCDFHAKSNSITILIQCLETGRPHLNHTVRHNLMATWRCRWQRTKLSLMVQLRLPKQIKLCGRPDRVLSS